MRSERKAWNLEVKLALAYSPIMQANESVRSLLNDHQAITSDCNGIFLNDK